MNGLKHINVRIELKLTKVVEKGALSTGLKHINVRIELKQTLRCYRLDSHKGLKHINVRIELKHIELISNRATYWRIKAYQCSYRTETSNCSHRAGLGRY